MDRPHVSIVVPVYQAEGCLQELHRRLIAELDGITSNFEIILVDDASRDGSWELVQALAKEDPRIRGFRFSRNFGQHYGLTAGLDYARGAWVVTMDCDLQDRPEEIHRLYEEAQKGYDVVLARRKRRHDTLYRRMASTTFYTVFNYLTDIRFDKEVAGFAIFSRRVVDAICLMRERDRFLMAFVQWVGFSVSKIDVEHADRHAGRTSYTIGRLLRLAWNTSLAFSNKPLHFAIRLGFAMSAFSSLMAAFVFWFAYTGRSSSVGTGWASLTVSLWFLAGLIIANLGIVGIYVGKVFDQAKARPLYVIGDMTSRTTAPVTRNGHVFWITGFAGSGKTTLAREVHGLLSKRGRPAILLDGDEFRAAMGNDLGHGPEDRLRNAERISRMCRLLTEQGLDCVCATQSLFHSVQRWNRECIPRYHEIYLKVSSETLRARDQKGLWSRGTGVVGMDQPYDEPERPDLVIHSEVGGDTPEVAANKVIGLLRCS